MGGREGGRRKEGGMKRVYKRYNKTFFGGTVITLGGSNPFSRSEMWSYVEGEREQHDIQNRKVSDI